MNDAVTPLGPLLSADRIFVTVTGSDKTPYQLEIFPDANNALLQTNALPQQYYFMPQRIYLAKKQDSPQDYDFGMTVFKGLLTPEDTVGINPGQATGGGRRRSRRRLLHLLDNVCYSTRCHSKRHRRVEDREV